jgi:hypothetical protein
MSNHEMADPVNGRRVGGAADPGHSDTSRPGIQSGGGDAGSAERLVSDYNAGWRDCLRTLRSMHEKQRFTSVEQLLALADAGAALVYGLTDGKS